MQDLLENLQEAVVNSSRPLPDALRLAKVLASRLQHPPLREWVDWELDGYPEKQNVPSYRETNIALKGHFLGPAGSSLKNALIPYSSLITAWGKATAAQWCRMSIRQGIAECEHLSQAKDELRVQVPPDLVVRIGGHVYSHMNCVDAFAQLSPGTLRGLVDSVRNRLLGFVLSLEETHGVAIADKAWRSVPAHSITQIFNHSILRDVAAGSSISQNTGRP